MNITKKKLDEVYWLCRKLALSRNERYGDSISMMRVASMLDLVLMKIYRTRKLSEEDSKFEDEIIDSINYLLYILMRRRQK